MNVFNQVITNLGCLEVKIAYEDKSIILLCSLLPSYEHLVITLIYGKDIIKVDEIIGPGWCIINKGRTQGRALRVIALYMKGDRGRKHDKERYGGCKSRSKSKNRKNIKYYKCKKMSI